MTSEPGLYHEFECEVADEEIEGIIKPQAHWNARHKPVKLLGYELVDEQDVEDVSSVTFSDLNGDEDCEYLLEYDFVPGGISSTTFLNIQPNGLSTNLSSITFGFGDIGGNNHGGTSYPYVPIGVIHVNNIRVSGHCKIKTKSGNVRTFSSELHDITSTQSQWYFLKGLWRDTSTNITSLVLTLIDGSFSGIIRLWKRLPLNTES